MKKWQEVPKDINGFAIVEDLGFSDKGGRYGIVICKECRKEFKTSIYMLHKIKSCGCLKYSQVKPLPTMINGFKIIEDLGYDNEKGRRRAIVECKVCKRHYEAHPHYLKERKHCGCMKRGSIVCKYAKSHPRLTHIYKHMLARCYRENSQDYYLYGAKGITICDEWKQDRNKFCEWALNNGYQENLSIDRIDGTKGYSPENCRWADSITQGRNTNRVVMSYEKAKLMRSEYTKLVKRLAHEYNVSDATVYNVLNHKSWVT